MIVYIICLLTSIFFAFIATKQKKKQSQYFFCFLSVLPFFLVSAIRYNVGTDYSYRYVSAFRIIKNGYDVPSLEVLFKLLIKFCLLISNKNYLLFIITSAFSVIPIYFLIFKRSKNPILSIFLYFCFGFFFQSMNLVRQYNALSIALLGFYLLNNDNTNSKKSKLLGFTLMIISCFFHSSSVIVLSYIIICKYFKRINLRTIFFFLIFLSLLIIMKNQFSNVINKVIQFSSYSGYLESKYAQAQFNIVTTLFHLVILFIQLYCYGKCKNRQQATYYIVVEMVVISSLVLCQYFSLFNRFTIYFSIFEIFSIPYFLSNIKQGKERLLFMVIILMISVSFLVYTNVLNNYNNVLPYQTIFTNY